MKKLQPLVVTSDSGRKTYGFIFELYYIIMCVCVRACVCVRVCACVCVILYHILIFCLCFQTHTHTCNHIYIHTTAQKSSTVSSHHEHSKSAPRKQKQKKSPAKKGSTVSWHHELSKSAQYAIPCESWRMWCDMVWSAINRWKPLRPIFPPISVYPGCLTNVRKAFSEKVNGGTNDSARRP